VSSTGGCRARDHLYRNDIYANECLSVAYR
jgi:hypothetical protein